MSEIIMTDIVGLTFDDNTILPVLYGAANENLTHLGEKLSVHISARGNEVSIEGDLEQAELAKDVLEKLYVKAQKNIDVGVDEVDDELRFIGVNSKKAALEAEAEEQAEPAIPGEISIKTRKKTIRPRSPMQREYLEILTQNDLTFGVGPAGTGKTYLAVAAAVGQFLDGNVERIILSRPAVEAGEKLGYLPGDMAAKLDPYLRPLYDALFDMLPQEMITKLMESGAIEIAPLAFMRGRTLSNSFIILDEAQNTTSTQMKMFLTRLGMGSKMAVTGDMSQIDLPKNQRSGLMDAIEKLKGVKGIASTNFSQKDVVRHPIAARIVDAYEKFDEPDLLENKDSWV